MQEKLRLSLLALIVLIYLIFGAAYALKTPTWETPDEPAHFNYVRYLAENLQLPILQVGDYDQAYLEKLKASKFPPSLSVDSIRYESWQPPLFYALSTPLYWLSKGLVLAKQVIVLRLLSVALGAILLVVSYGLTRSIFPKDDLLALAVPGFIAALPQHVAMTAALSDDTLAEVLFALILLVLVRRITEVWPSSQSRERGSEAASSVLLGVLLGLTLLTKTTLYVSLALIPLGLLFREYALSGRRVRIGPLARQLAIVFAIALVVSGWWFVRNALVYGGLDLFGWTRHDLVVQGQPRTEVFNLSYVKFLTTVTFQSFWAQFGWMGVLAGERTYTLLWVLSTVAAAGAALFLLQVLRRPDTLTLAQRLSLLLLGLTFVSVLVVLVFYNFRFIQAQGRYLFPALIPIALFFALGLRELVAQRYRALLFALLYLALLGLDYVSLTRLILPQLAG